MERINLVRTQKEILLADLSHDSSRTRLQVWIENFLKQNVLLEQPYFREASHTVQQLIAENISKLQENITVRRFARFSVRES